MFDFSERIRQKLQAKEVLKIQESSVLFFALAIIVLLVSAVFLIVPQYFTLKEVKADIALTNENIGKIQSQIEEKEKDLSQEEDGLSEYQEKYAPRIAKVLPDSEQISELTQFLENFSLELEKKGAISLSTISYGASKNMGEYSILPVRLSFGANDVNFVHFLQMINKSGSIEEKDFYEGEAVRLMRVDRISVSIPRMTENSKEEGLYNIGLEISAFYQNPKITEEKVPAKKK